MSSKLVWIEAPEKVESDAFLPGEVVSIDGDFTEVKVGLSVDGIKKGEVRRVATKDTRQRFPTDDKVTSADNTALVYMNDASILENLQRRHAQDEIYTYTASVLLAVNPYRVISGLYGESQCRLYRGKHLGALPPHPYAISDTAYRLLVREKTNQALLISGESGAGKTETAKLVVEYLAFASGSTSELADKIQNRLVQAQPILESIGNAATLRNSNSSRFGKYTRVFFDNGGTLVDAGITTYLLESSRVVIHGEGERTYHVFYEMLQGLPDDKLKALHLDRTRNYRLMHNAAPVGGFEAHDKNNFERLCAALETIGLTQEEIDGFLQILAGLVHLGDIPKEDGTSAVEQDEDEMRCVHVNEDSVTSAAELLGMDRDELCGTLKRRKIQIPGRDSFQEVARSPMQFRHALQSLIKALYGRLFEQTVSRVNDSFAELRAQKTPGDDWNNIGILDIYGFECLRCNSFEQLCINLANERLQQYFVENVLSAEQLLYKREGLPWTGLELPNSEPVVNCISYVFKTLDDFSSRLAKGFGEAQQVSDDRFCERVLKECVLDPERKDVLKAPKVSAKSARNSTGPKANEAFVITHYAGPVGYNTKGWLDKNNDRLLVECENLILHSDCSAVKALGEEDTKQTFRSISSKYSKDLEALLQTLSEANLHYIRCFKPNAVQKAGIFSGKLVLDQIVQCGTIELVKIMHDGFPNRCAFEELCNRFKSLLPEKFQRYGQRTFIEALMLAYEVPRGQWALGMSLLFLKAGQLKALEDMRAEGAVPKPEILDRIVKQIIRKRWSRACEAVKLCNYLPKLLQQVYVKRAASTLTATALVTSRLAPRLEAARRRVAERRLVMRRRLGAAFRTVFCLNVAWRQLREQRCERLFKAFQQYSFIAKRTKPWLEKARASLQNAELRRQREEQRRLQELEQKMKEEEERLRVEAQNRRQQEEEQFRLQAEKQKQEEEARLQAEAEKRLLDEEAKLEAKAEQERIEEERALALEQERLALARKMEEEQQEAERRRVDDRKFLEVERLKIEEERRRFAEQMQVDKETLAKEMQDAMGEQMRLQAEMMAAERKRMTDEISAQRLEQEKRMKEDMEQNMLKMQEMHQDTVRRLSVTQQSSGCWSEDKSATEVISTRMAGEDAETDIGDSVSVVPGNVSQLVQDEVSRLMAGQAEMMSHIQQQVMELQKKNKDLEHEAFEMTPEHLAEHGNGKAASTLENCPSPFTPNSGMSHQGSKSSRQHGHSVTGLDSNDSLRKTGQRHSVACDALLNTAPREGIPASDQNKQRKWWAEQRNFLMEDLYQMSPTPARNNRRQSQGGSTVSVGKALGPAFDQAKSEEVEWVVDCQNSEETKSRKAAQ